MVGKLRGIPPNLKKKKLDVLPKCFLLQFPYFGYAEFIIRRQTLALSMPPLSSFSSLEI